MEPCLCGDPYCPSCGGLTAQVITDDDKWDDQRIINAKLYDCPVCEVGMHERCLPILPTDPKTQDFVHLSREYYG